MGVPLVFLVAAIAVAIAVIVVVGVAVYACYDALIHPSSASPTAPTLTTANPLVACRLELEAARAKIAALEAQVADLRRRQVAAVAALSG